MLSDIPIDSLPTTSKITINRLKSIGIETYHDLLNFFPFRYEDYSLTSEIGQIQEGEVVTVKGKIVKAKFEITKRGTKIQKFVLQKNSSEVDLVWYNQPYLLRIIKPGMLLSVAGLVKKFKNRLTVEPKEYELIQSEGQKTIHTGRIIPIYSEKQGLSSRTLREKMFYLLNKIDFPIREILPTEILKYNNLLDLDSASRNIHFPQNNPLAKRSRERLAFNELFLIQLSASLIREEWKKERVGHQFHLNHDINESIQQFKMNLPFRLTNAQNRSLKEILNDLAMPIPMNRLLQGDVGSGKTVVAAMASFFTYLNDCQTLFMAPTEILAYQHYQTVSELFKNNQLRIGLQTKSKKINLKDDYDIIIGTHALINEKLKFDRVGLIIIDEQHRFGVAQRNLLKNKGINPHLLTMTATPIPRTVALTLWAELDLSVIDEMPKGRLPVKTYLVPEEKKESGYQWIKKQIKNEGAQVFIICPLIDESEVETMQSVKAAKKEYEYLKSRIFTEFNIGLIHGKLKSKEKDKIMEDFKNKRCDILVATSVVEVGIDIPNATIMIIEGAERFGLAQLHQLRGRIGRGNKQSYCFLFTSNHEQINIHRLNFFTKSLSGNELAMYDLKIRGPGDIYGTKQHGFIDLKVATLTDFSLIKKTQGAAAYFMNKYKNLTAFQEIKKLIDQRRVEEIARD